MEEKKQKFKLSKVNWIFALIIITFSAFIFLKSDGVNGFSLGYLLGSIITVGLIPLVFAFIVWLVKGKKHYAGTYTFNIVLVLICFGMIKEFGTISKEKTESINEITKSVSDYKEKINNEEDAISAYEEHTAIVNDGISKMIRNSSGNEQEVYKNFQKFTSINSSVMVDWQKAYDSILTPRILDYSVLSTQKEFDYQIAVLEHYQKQSIKYRDHFEKRISLLDSLNKNIPKGNLTLKGIMKGINKTDSIQKPIFRPFITTHLNYSNNLIEMVDFLNTNKGKWKYHNDELFFDNNILEKKYSEIIEKIAQDENKINELADKLIDIM